MRAARRGHAPLRAGQATMEYALMAATVAAAIVGMSLYARRGVQAAVRVAADQIGTQKDGIRYESGDRRNKSSQLGQTLLRETGSAQTVRSQTDSQSDPAPGFARSTRSSELTETRGSIPNRAPNLVAIDQTVINER